MTGGDRSQSSSQSLRTALEPSKTTLVAFSGPGNQDTWSWEPTKQLIYHIRSLLTETQAQTIAWWSPPIYSDIVSPTSSQQFTAHKVCISLPSQVQTLSIAPQFPTARHH